MDNIVFRALRMQEAYDNESILIALSTVTNSKAKFKAGKLWGSDSRKGDNESREISQ